MHLKNTLLNNFFQGEIIKEFSGNSGKVYLVKNNATSPAYIAYKTCKELCDESKNLFDEEVLKWNSINSRYIVPIYYVHKIMDEYYACMRACEGTLADLMLREKICEISAYIYALQIIKGLMDMNNSSIQYHQDFNPQNILFEDMSRLFNGFPSEDMHSSHRYRMMISDFAMSNYYVKNNIAGRAGGKFPFKAPEQYEDSQLSDFEPDRFALGVLLCMLFTGKHPCGYGPEQILRNNPKKLKTSWKTWANSGTKTVDFHNDEVTNLIIKLLSTEPNERPDYKECFDVIRTQFKAFNSDEYSNAMFYIGYFDQQHSSYPREKLRTKVN